MPKQPLAGAFKSFLGDLPKLVEFGESATKDKAGQQAGGDTDTVDYGENVDKDRLALDRKIRQYMQALVQVEIGSKIGLLQKSN